MSEGEPKLPTVPGAYVPCRRRASRPQRTTDNAAIQSTTDSWRPYRAWVALLLRAWREAETGEITHGRRSTTHLKRLDA